MPIDLNDDNASLITRKKAAPVERRECPCGADAVWCRSDTVVVPSSTVDDIIQLDSETAAFGVRQVTGNDLYEDLCNDCFEDAVPVAERGKWRRITPAAN